jgi:ribose/xylose/arabinose/galactoside ABC-type transport system permease subunit
VRSLRLQPAQRRRLLRAGLPLAVFTAIVVALVALPLYSDTSATTFTVYNAGQNFASLGLLALAVGLTLIVGEFDLSTLGMYALGGLLAVKLGGGSPFVGVAAAVAVGLAVGLLQGAIMARTGISSVPLTLGGYIALLGLSHVVGNSNTLAYKNLDAGIWLDTITATFFSPRSLIVLAVFVIVGGVLRWTRLGRDVRAVGGDRRASRAAGVPTDGILIGVFALSGCFSALGGALFAYSTSAAKPDLGLAPFVFGVTAALLGGVSLTGGRGGATGVFLGVLSLSLLQELFALLGTQSYVVNLVQGSLLVLVVIFEAPDLRRRLTTMRARLADRAAAARPEDAPSRS